MRSQKSWLKELGQEGLRATSLGWELAAPIFGGVLLGHYLDRTLGTTYTFTLGLLVAGVGAGFYNLWRFTQRLNARERRSKEAARRHEQGDESAGGEAAS
jgi:predicted F0F1-ATPase subunit